MQSHEDNSHARNRMHEALNKEWLDSLEKKANKLVSEKKSTITAGEEDELPLTEYSATNEVHVKRLPEDKHGIIRISAGGGDNLPVKCNYVVFRGNPKQTIQLLRKALAALEEGF